MLSRHPLGVAAMSLAIGLACASMLHAQEGVEGAVTVETRRPPMLEALKTESKLFGLKVVTAGAAENDTLREQFFKKNLLENRAHHGALIEGMAELLGAGPSRTRDAGETAEATARLGKMQGWLEASRGGGEMPAEVIDFCQLYLRLWALALAEPSRPKDFQETAGQLEKDLSAFAQKNPKEAWGGVLLALTRDLTEWLSLESSLEKSAIDYLQQASVLAVKQPQLHFSIGHLYRDYVDREDLSNFLKLVGTEFEKCLMQQRRNKELFAEITSVYVEVHETLQQQEIQEPFWFEELVYRRIITLDPSNASAHNNLSFLYSQYGVNLKDALREAQIANQLRPDDPLLLDTLGWAQYKNGMLDKAIESLGKAISIDSEIADVHFHLATVYYDLDDVANASREFRETLRLEPDNAFARNNLAYLFSLKGVQLEEALTLVDEALELQPENAAFIDTKGWIYYRMKDYPRAVEHLKRAVELQPETSELHMHLGKVYLAMRRFDSAVKSFENALTYDPDNAAIAQELAYVFAVNGLRDSLERYSRISGVAQDKKNFKIFYDAMAQLAIAAGDYENARLTLEEFTGLQPAASQEPTRESTEVSEGERPLHEQLELLGEMVSPETDLFVSVERPGLMKLFEYATRAIGRNWGVPVPELPGPEYLPNRVAMAITYDAVRNASDFTVLLEATEPMFDQYWDALESLGDDTHEVPFPVGGLTIPFNIESAKYKGVTVRTITVPQGSAHLVLSKPFVIFSSSHDELTGLIDQVEVKSRGLSGLDVYRRFASRQTGPSDFLIFMPFGGKAASGKLPEEYQAAFDSVKAFGAGYTLPSTDELHESSLFIPVETVPPVQLQSSLQELVETVRKDIVEKVSDRISLEVTFSIQEDVVVGDAVLKGLGDLVQALISGFPGVSIPGLEALPSIPSTPSETGEEPLPEETDTDLPDEPAPEPESAPEPEPEPEPEPDQD